VKYNLNSLLFVPFHRCLTMPTVPEQTSS